MEPIDRQLTHNFITARNLRSALTAEHTSWCCTLARKPERRPFGHAPPPRFTRRHLKPPTGRRLGRSTHWGEATPCQRLVNTQESSTTTPRLLDWSHRERSRSAAPHASRSRRPLGLGQPLDRPAAATDDPTIRAWERGSHGSRGDVADFSTSPMLCFRTSSTASIVTTSAHQPKPDTGGVANKRKLSSLTSRRSWRPTRSS